MIGRTVSHYKILDRLGEGGMGSVYLGEDLHTGQKLAIKFLTAGRAPDPDARKRFIQEAGAAYALEHPAVGVVNEVDETEDGQLFIAMRYYDGGTLQARLESDPLDCDEALDIVIQLGKGLAHAHQHGIVHRDLKPANVMFAATGEAKIVDFGLALLVEQERLTMVGATLGTPSYMSPEQASGQDTDARTDLFSLGIILHELVSGQRPFDGQYTAAVVHQIVYEEPRALTAQVGEMPGGLAEVVARALQKDPQLRYQSAEEMVADLEAVRAGRTDVVLGREASRTVLLPSAAKAVRRRGIFLKLPLLVWTMLALAAVLIAGFGLDWGRGRSVSLPDHALAVFDFQDAGTVEEQIVSAGIMSLLNVGLLENCPVRMVSSEYLAELRHRLFGSAAGPVEAEQTLPVARESGATLLLVGQINRIGENRFVTWRLVDTRSGESLVAGRIESVDDPFLAANEILARALPAISAQSGVEAVDEPRSVEAMSTDSPEALRHYIAAIEASNADRRADADREFGAAIRADSTFALAYLAMVVHYLPLDTSQSWVHLESAWKWRHRLGHRDLLRLELFQKISESKYEMVWEKYEELLERWPDDRTLLNDYTLALKRWGKYGRVYEVAPRCLQYYPDDLLFQMYGCFGLVTRQYADALTAARSMVATHPREPMAWDVLGSTFWLNALPDSADAAFATALRLDPTFMDSEVNLALSPYFRGDLDGAIDGYLTLMERKNFGPTWYWAFGAWQSFGLASIYCEAGRYTDVEAMFEAAGIDTLHRGYIYEQNFLLLMMRKPDEVLRIELPREQYRSNLFCGFAYAAVDSLEAAQREYELKSAAWTDNGDIWPQTLRLLGASIALQRGEPERCRELLAEAWDVGVFYLGALSLGVGVRSPIIPDRRPPRRGRRGFAGHAAPLPGACRRPLRIGPDPPGAG